MFEGRFPALLHALHPFSPFNLSFRTIILAAANGSMSLTKIRPSFPSQSGHEIQPTSRYVLFGWDGMLEGRWPDLHHSSHSFLLFSLSLRTIALESRKESIAPFPPCLPSQFGSEIQPSSRYVWRGLDGMLEGRCPALLHACHSFSLFSLSFRTIALAAAMGSMPLVLISPPPPQRPSL